MLLYLDSFDDRTSAYENRFGAKTAGVYTAAFAGRTGNCMGLDTTSGGANVRHTNPSALATYIVGFAVKFNSLHSAAFVQFLDGTTEHWSLYGNGAGGGIIAKNGAGTTLGTSAAGVLAAGTFAYVEIKHTINNSTGSVTVKVNGVTVISVTGVDTQNTGNATSDGFQLTNIGASSAMFVDDLYVCDTTGSYNNDFLGPIQVQCLKPSGAGNSTQWTPDSGSNYARVNEAHPDDDTSYVAANTVGNKDTYALGNLASTGVSVLGTQRIMRARVDTTGSHGIKDVQRIGGTDYEGAEKTVSSTSYGYYYDIDEVSPATGVAYTPTEINAMELGITISS